MTLVVTLLFALIGFLTLTAWLAKMSKELWGKERYGTVVAWIVYAVVLGVAYGEFVWDQLEPHRWREWLKLLLGLGAMWAVVIASVFLLALILYAVSFVRGTDDAEGLGLGRPGRAAERLVKHLLARWRAKPGTIEPRGPK